MSAESAAALAGAPTARKRAAPDQEPRAADANKRPRYGGFRSIDEFELFEVLGEGAEGIVRRGRDRRTGKKVALKWIFGDGPGGHGDPDHRAFAMEAGCLHACRGHPSIIGIQDVAADPGTGDVHLVLELVAGGVTLRESIWRPLSEDVVRLMMRQLISAAKKIHGVGFIHRDMKPENVLVCPFGELKVCDFGSATRQKPAGKELEGPYPVGTLQYNAPELLDGNRRRHRRRCLRRCPSFEIRRWPLLRESLIRSSWQVCQKLGVMCSQACWPSALRRGSLQQKRL